MEKSFQTNLSMEMHVRISGNWYEIFVCWKLFWYAMEHGTWIMNAMFPISIQNEFNAKYNMKTIIMIFNILL